MRKSLSGTINAPIILYKMSNVPHPRKPCRWSGGASATSVSGSTRPCGSGTRGRRDQLYEKGLSGKSILGVYFQENKTSRRPFLLLRISFPERPILYNCLQAAFCWMVFQVSFPDLSAFLPEFLPFSLRFVDDWETGNKVRDSGHVIRISGILTQL